MKSFFNPDNFLWRGFAYFSDFFMLTACWILCSVPLITMGSATIALYDAAAHGLRMQEPGMYRRFFRTFKKELLRGSLLTLICAAGGLLLNFSYQAVQQLAGESHPMIVTVYFCLMLLPMGWACWVFALESRFSTSLGTLLVNGGKFMLGYLPRTIVIVVLLVIALNVCIQLPFLVIVMPGALVFLQSGSIEKVFKNYMPEDEADSIEEPV